MRAHRKGEWWSSDHVPVLSAMGSGWWASIRLASALKRPHAETQAILRSLQRIGQVETGGQLWRRTSAGKDRVASPNQLSRKGV